MILPVRDNARRVPHPAPGSWHPDGNRRPPGTSELKKGRIRNCRSGAPCRRNLDCSAPAAQRPANNSENGSPPMRTKTHHLPDLDLCFDDWEGDGRPVIFLHATGFSRRCWRPMAAALAERCRPILVDLPGHGGSSGPATPVSWGHWLTVWAPSFRSRAGRMPSLSVIRLAGLRRSRLPAESAHRWRA